MGSEVTKPMTPMEDFQFRVVEKLKVDIGSMLPDEVLQGLTQKALNETFFQPRVMGEGWNKKESPSWFVEEVTRLAKPLLEAEVKRFVDENQEVLKTALNTFLTQNNLMLVAISHLEGVSATHMRNLVTAINEVSQRLHKVESKIGC